MWRFILTIGLSAVALGCASNPTNPTQQTALLLVDELDSYNEQVQTKIDAEEAFYAEILAAADAAAGRQAWFAQAMARRTSIIELADQAIVRDKGLRVTLLQEFLREQNRLAETRRQDLASLRAELDKNYRVSFDSLALKTQQLNTVRAQLMNLAQDRDNRAFLITKLQEAASLALKEQNLTDPPSQGQP